ncbi:MAG: cyclodeaminase/cyclohydrolase family protein [Oscillospiraceae bacterium]|nr:cyclodeaminase/cyclohydrolase family protein [Oscillospiraceae bacterium]
MSFIDNNLKEFTDVLASKAAVPGGGGASALVGAVGVALGSMVGNLTLGKKKYAEFEQDILAAMEKAEAIRAELLHLMDEDAVVFEPLSKAYGIPKDDPNRAEIMENALKAACSVPMDIMRTVCKAIDLHAEFAKKGSALAISDVGVGVACCKAALQGASLNVFINTKSMTDKAYAADIEKEADEMLTKYCAMADEIYAAVVGRLR